jgi:hypothetical protein
MNPPTGLQPRTKVLILVGMTLASALLVFSQPVHRQNPKYHKFADQRTFFGVPNCLNVVSNGLFLCVGALGLKFLLSRQTENAFTNSAERYPYLVLFFGVAATALGSSYYHLAPDNARLVWDRIPMTLGFTGFFCAMVAERISLRASLLLLAPLTSFGVGTVVYWYWSESIQAGDVRPYFFVQYYSFLAVPVILALFPPRYSRPGYVLVTLALYGIAKIFEALDRPIYEATGVSGHTLKHVAAAGATWALLRMIQHRTILKPLPQENPSLPRNHQTSSPCA